MIKEQNRICVKAELVAIREGDYTVYVFENLGYRNEDEHFIMCTRCPKWNTPEVEIGQTGFLSYQYIIAGTDKWYCQTDNVMVNYAQSAIYFLDFVPITRVLQNGRVVEGQTLIIT